MCFSELVACMRSHALHRVRLNSIGFVIIFNFGASFYSPSIDTCKLALDPFLSRFTHFNGWTMKEMWPVYKQKVEKHKKLFDTITISMTRWKVEFFGKFSGEMWRDRKIYEKKTKNLLEALKQTHHVPIGCASRISSSGSLLLAPSNCVEFSEFDKTFSMVLIRRSAFWIMNEKRLRIWVMQFDEIIWSIDDFWCVSFSMRGIVKLSCFAWWRDGWCSWFPIFGSNFLNLILQLIYNQVVLNEKKNVSFWIKLLSSSIFCNRTDQFSN